MKGRLKNLFGGSENLLSRDPCPLYVADGLLNEHIC
jgi:hypothetical protein